MSQKISIGVGPHNFEIYVSNSWIYELFAAVPFLRGLLNVLQAILTRCRYTYTPQW